MASEKRPRRVPAVLADTRRNPGFALGAFGLSAWAYIGMSHTIADYEGPRLGYALGVAYEALVIGLAWEGRRRADRALETGRPVSGHVRWLGGAIVVGILSGALAAWHGWLLGEGIFAISRAVAPVLAAVAVHLFFQSASSARDLDRQAEIHNDRQTAVLDMLDAVRLAQIAPPEERAARIADVNAAVGRVHRHVPADVTAEVTRPHLESERTIRDVVQEAAALAGEWMPSGREQEERARQGREQQGLEQHQVPLLPEPVEAEALLLEAAEPEPEPQPEPEPEPAEEAVAEVTAPDVTAPEVTETAGAAPMVAERVRLAAKYAPVTPEPARSTVVDEPADGPAQPLTTAQISEIRVLRWAQTLSVEEVAARVGVSVASVKRYAPSTDPTTETGSLMAVSSAS
ncbi:hypothetical protein ACFQHV_20420 [Promicromonospora thailandica]|uniref:Uncharacterized protein n=1 Tax=Promicromonospora thailandica TaxID=765201 RepID=A0A9X2G296_9MICO|nr:hypothetical protein [Promicromonospora thailandica]MCP2264133.1 hypothetical protein [Promicromonospora thailandica]BFF21204.1 hypothetical protein GCM10025730_47250 [Promicromonospora thailandica]